MSAGEWCWYVGQKNVNRQRFVYAMDMGYGSSLVFENLGKMGLDVRVTNPGDMPDDQFTGGGMVIDNLKLFELFGQDETSATAVGQRIRITMNFQILAEDFDPDTVNWNMKRDEVGRFVAGTAPSLFDDLIALYKALQPSGENVFFTAETNDVDDLLNNLIDGRGILPIPSDLSVFKVRPEEEESIFFGKVAWVGGICHTDCMQLRAPAHYTILGLVLLVAGMGAGLGYGLSRTHTNPGMAKAHPQENGNAFFDLDDPICAPDFPIRARAL